MLFENFGTLPMVVPGLSWCLSQVFRTFYFHVSFEPFFYLPSTIAEDLDLCSERASFLCEQDIPYL